MISPGRPVRPDAGMAEEPRVEYWYSPWVLFFFDFVGFHSLAFGAVMA